MEKLCVRCLVNYMDLKLLSKIFLMFGERQKISGAYATVIGIFKYQIENNLPLTISGDGEQKEILYTLKI